MWNRQAASAPNSHAICRLSRSGIHYNFHRDRDVMANQMDVRSAAAAAR